MPVVPRDRQTSSAIRCDPISISITISISISEETWKFLTLSHYQMSHIGQQVVRLIDGKGQVTVRNWFLNWGALARESFLYNEQMDVNF